MWTACTHITHTAIGTPYVRMQRAASAGNAAMPFATRSAASMATCPNLPKTPRMLRALSAPAPVTS
eukprot:6604279-Alexandrium_andersonii.AAC.1